jgi:serine/threonine-protein kinase HipA
MVSNVVARNQDDHVKNIAFIMDRDGAWSLSLKFDVTYANNPAGDWTATHQMSINGWRDRFTADDFAAVARAAGMKSGAPRSSYERFRRRSPSGPGSRLELGLLSRTSGPLPRLTASRYLASEHRPRQQNARAQS